MHVLPDELRLAVTVAVNLLTIAGAARFVLRRGVRDRVQVLCDAFLLWYAIQYAAVTLPGVVGLLGATTAPLVGIAIAVALQSVPRASSSGAATTPRERVATTLCAVMLCAFIAAIIWNARTSPVIANDSLTYHLPAAAQWVQTGRVGLYETWFYNPANTYSPLAGSTFIAWLMAPMGNDVLARFVAAPALLMLFFGMTLLCRSAGAGICVAALVTLAACCARPFISQVILAKDDLFVVAFFVAAAAALAPGRLRDGLGSWRLGIAVGLLLATKYTALLSLPLLLLAADAPWRAGWRWHKLAILAGLVLVIAGPWYARNIVLTGNPLYPADVSVCGFTLFQGMFTALRSDRLRNFEAIWNTFTGAGGADYYSLVAPVWIALILLWMIATVGSIRSMWRCPILRLTLIGPVLGIALFVTQSPYAETRFAYPSIALFFVAAAVAIGMLPARASPIIAASLLFAATFGTSFKSRPLLDLVGPFMAMLVIAFAVVAILESRRPRAIGAAAIGVVVALGMCVFVLWPRYLLECEQTANDVWTGVYGRIADAWRYVRDELPAGETVAYANTYFTYPLIGPRLDRPVTYAPTRRGLTRYRDLARFDSATTGEEIPRQVLAITLRDPDHDTWIKNLRTRGARWLFVARQDVAHPQRTINPPELAFARADPTRFRVVFENDAATIFQVIRD
jgi:hypothetical protein